MKSIVLCIFLWVAGIEVYSQTYQPFPDSGAVWRENGYDVSGSPNSYTNYFYELSFSGDTVIGPYIYHQLNANGFGMNYLWWNGGWTGPFTVPFPWCCNGAIREDTQKRIYYYDYITAVETILYDFNLNIGDTLPPSYISYANSNVVSGIDSILINGQYHKRYSIDAIINPGYPFAYYIEGIGSTTGLLGGQVHITQPPFEIYSNLICFSDSGSHNLIDTLSSLSDCDLPDDIASPESENVSVSVFPNPVSEILVIDTKVIFEKVFITDITGKVIIQNFFAKTKQSSTHFSLDVSALTPGIYFLEVRNDLNAGRCLFIRQ